MFWSPEMEPVLMRHAPTPVGVEPPQLEPDEPMPWHKVLEEVVIGPDL